jgi:NAD(P)-dependent dehydrogenase (short-subunit alcohol dehydrogenase family)
MSLLEGQVAVVTGAGNGIGASVARLLAQHGAAIVANDLGTSIAGVGRDPAVAAAMVEDLQSSGARAVASDHDVTSRSSAEQLIHLAIDKFGQMDILVNCAAIQRDRALLNMDDDTWRAVIDAQLTGTFNCMRAAAEVMRAQNRGRIVNTTNTAGLLGGFGQCNTAAASAGVYGLTRTAAIELQRHGVMVNAVAPLARTRQTEELPMFQKTTALSAEHVAPVYLFLASHLAGNITGQVLAVAGSRISVIRMVESHDHFKETDSGIWTAEEIAGQFSDLSRS